MPDNDNDNWAGRYAAQLGMQTGAGLIGSGVNGILGLIFGRKLAQENDDRQYNQANRLGQLQLGFNKQMTDYQMMKQLEMWEKTNFSAQKEQMKKAGLNPALLYGMGGAGGATVGGGAAQSGGSQQAPHGGGEIMGMMSLAQQQQLNQANIELMKSQANLNNVEADKKKGVDTDNTKATTESIKQGINESEAREKLTNTENAIKEVELNIKQQTSENQIAMVGTALQKIHKEFEILSTQDFQNKNTVLERIKQAEIETIGMLIDNDLKKQQITESKERINKMAQDILQGWKKSKPASKTNCTFKYVPWYGMGNRPTEC